MTRVIRREVRKRGFFSWIFLLLFLGFNALMLWALVAGLQGVDAGGAATDTERAGRVIGGAIGAGMLLFFWAVGSVILGVLALVTRGRKTVVEEVTR